MLQRLSVSEELGCFIAPLAKAVILCDTYEMHLQALQNWPKFNTEQDNISVLLHTLFPIHLLPDC